MTHVTRNFKERQEAERDGRHYPTTSLDAFVKWAKEDVTEQMPRSHWREA